LICKGFRPNPFHFLIIFTPDNVNKPLQIDMRVLEMSCLVLVLACLAPLKSTAQNADTTWVQTYTFEAQNNPETAYDSPGRRWFQFPASDNDTSYQKILMYHTLKCFEDGTAGGLGYACGEWDYLTYTYLFDHTGLLDSNLLTHPHYLVDDLGIDTADIIHEPVGGAPYDTIVSFLSRPDGVIGGQTFAEAATGESFTLLPDAGPLRNQFLWTADELTAMGLTAGAITALEFPVDMWPGGGYAHLRAQTTALDSLAAIVEGGWQTTVEWVFEGGSNPVGFPLTTPLNWDGTSNLLVEWAIESNSSPILVMPQVQTTEAPGKTLQAHPAGRFIRFDGNDRFEVDVDGLNAIGQEVTVEFWQRGNAAAQPENNSICEAVNAGNNREINIHLPWSNGRVYWDAGYDGGYDRIDQAAAESDYEGVWHHWAFTKNATEGTMKIYLDGVLWHSGVDKDNALGEMVRMHIGCNGNGGNDYRGDVDAFRIWAADLAPEVIADWRDREVTMEHPALDALVRVYDFDGENGTNPANGWNHGNAGRFGYRAAECFWEPAPVYGDARPAISITAGGEMSDALFAAEHVRAVPVPPTSVATFEVQGNAVNWTSLTYGWPAGSAAEKRTAEGSVLASYPIDGEITTYVNSTLEYYSAPFPEVNRVELARYITPYGIGLTLGDDGWTWIFDVTDYAPLLRDSVQLEAGNWQELLDLKFAFIEGTPPRDVKRVEAFWNGTWNLNSFDSQITDHTFTPEPGEEMFRLKTRASGHGFGSGNNCGEFCYNTHSVAVNGQTEWSWEIMRECADNPLYPQGGTWIYDRAGWCPGAPVDSRDWELTDLVSPAEPFAVDYNIDYDPDGNYRFEGQIIAYSAPHFSHDVEISEILSPSDFKLHSRTNPICEAPTVRIRNNGSEPLTSCTFTYYVSDASGNVGATATGTWGGSLGFLEEVVVALPYDDPMLFDGGDEEVLTFHVTVSDPNGQADEQPSNNATSSRFHRVPTYAYDDLNDNRIIVWTKTNSAPWETQVEITNADGEVVWQRGYTGMNETYRDTLELNQGCYRFTINDAGDDGSSFWANSDGSGFTRLKRVAGGNFINFEPDFGKSISQAFYFETNLISGVEEVVAPAVEPSLVAFPNPASGDVRVRIQGLPAAEVMREVTWRDAMGRIVHSDQIRLQPGDLITQSVASWPPGMYAVTLEGVGTARVLVK
jgi:hypothetical protein